MILQDSDFTVDQGLQELKPNGETTLKYLFATNRTITVDFDTWVKDIVLDTSSGAYTANASNIPDLKYTRSSNSCNIRFVEI